MNQNFWRGKRVFLTGHTGFKGGWLSLWLQQLGAELTGYALYPQNQHNLFEKAHVSNGMTSIIGDIRDGEKLSASLSDAMPDVVIHMAAQPLVRYSYANPVETYSTNVMGTVNLLEAVRNCESVRAVVNVTSDKCYENKEWNRPYAENDTLGGYDPYSSSKACAELVTSAYRNSFFKSKEKQIFNSIALATARSGNVIGGGDWAVDRLVPDILRSFSQGEPVSIRNPQSTRPWQHVLESLRGYLILSEHLFNFGAEYAEAFNFGPREEDVKTVEWVVSKIAEKWGEDKTWNKDIAENPHEANLLMLDISKAANKLNWHPILSLENALELTIEWNRNYNNGKNAQEITTTQIMYYQSILNKFKTV